MNDKVYNILKYVAPYMGAWIETFHDARCERKDRVAPYMGAWIETTCSMRSTSSVRVAPYMGAWIETDQTGERS